MKGHAFQFIYLASVSLFFGEIANKPGFIPGLVGICLYGLFSDAIGHYRRCDFIEARP